VGFRIALAADSLSTHIVILATSAIDVALEKAMARPTISASKDVTFPHAMALSKRLLFPCYMAMAVPLCTPPFCENDPSEKIVMLFISATLSLI
jgi:hypothetical protein